MNETDHIGRRFTGGPGELVTMHVRANGTSHMVNYNLDSVPHVLPAGTSIQFPLKNAVGDVTRLQLIMDYNAAGSYEIEIENVAQCTADDEQTGSCKHNRPGPPSVIENYKFSIDA